MINNTKVDITKLSDGPTILLHILCLILIFIFINFN